MLDQFRSQNYNFLIRFLNTVRASLSWSASSGVILRVALFENPRAPGALPSILYKFFPMYVLKQNVGGQLSFVPRSTLWLDGRSPVIESFLFLPHCKKFNLHRQNFVP